MILIFSRQDDMTTSLVLEWLTLFNKNYIRIDADNERTKFISYNANNRELLVKYKDKLYNLYHAQSFWFRRNGFSFNNLTFNKTFSNCVFHNNADIHIKHLQDEYSELYHFFYSALKKECFLTLGSKTNSALNKLEVLEIARELNFIIPETFIVTSKTDLIKIITSSDKFVITKAIGNGVYHFTNAFGYYSYTERLTLDNIEKIPDTFFPSLIQYEVKKQYELRVFYLKGIFYSMAIFSQTDTQTIVDFRKYNTEKPNRTIPYLLPKEIEDKIDKIMCVLNLDTGSIDLIVDENDDYVFLEINPVGQFTMTSLPCNYYLEKKVAEIL